MTVQEWIDKLNNYPKDMQVVLETKNFRGNIIRLDPSFQFRNYILIMHEPELVIKLSSSL